MLLALVVVLSFGSVGHAAEVMVDSDPIYLNGYFAHSGDDLYDFIVIHHPNEKIGVYVKNLTSFDVQWYVEDVRTHKIYGQGILYSKGSIMSRQVVYFVFHDLALLAGTQW
ncbi:MAG TPA: hypothetical protein VIL07_00660 [Symbiobacteriaceae bacterium]